MAPRGSTPRALFEALAEAARLAPPLSSFCSTTSITSFTLTPLTSASSAATKASSSWARLPSHAQQSWCMRLCCRRTTRIDSAEYDSQ